MVEVTLGESIQTWIVVIVVAILFSVGVGMVAYFLTKPVAQWVFDPLEDDNEQ